MSRSIAEILAVAEDPAYIRVATAKVSLVSQALRDEHAGLDARLKVLHKQRDTVDMPPELLETAERLQQIEAEIEAAAIEFRFRAVGHRLWADLLRKYPPTKHQIAQNEKIDHNPEVFPYEAMAASCADPVMTPDEVRQLESSPIIDVASWMALWGACLKANVGAAVPKSMAAGLILHRNGESAVTAVNGGFPAASSSGE